LNDNRHHNRLGLDHTSETDTPEGSRNQRCLCGRGRSDRHCDGNRRGGGEPDGRCGRRGRERQRGHHGTGDDDHGGGFARRLCRTRDRRRKGRDGTQVARCAMATRLMARHSEATSPYAYEVSCRIRMGDCTRPSCQQIDRSRLYHQEGFTPRSVYRRPKTWVPRSCQADVESLERGDRIRRTASSTSPDMTKPDNRTQRTPTCHISTTGCKIRQFPPCEPGAVHRAGTHHICSPRATVSSSPIAVRGLRPEPRGSSAASCARVDGASLVERRAACGGQGLDVCWSGELTARNLALTHSSLEDRPSPPAPDARDRPSGVFSRAIQEPCQGARPSFSIPWCRSEPVRRPHGAHTPPE
jgi:hypothetical protein